MPTSADEGHLQMRSATCARRRNDRIPKLRPPAGEACKFITLDPRKLDSSFEPARLRRPRLAPRPAPRRRHKTTLYGPNGYAGERGAAPPPAQLRTPAANAPPGFPGRGGISADPCTPRMCWSRSPLRRRDYKLQKGGTTCTWPAQWLLFSISDPKKRCAQ